MMGWLLVILGVFVGLMLLLTLWRALGWWRWRRRRTGALSIVLSGPLSDVPPVPGWRAWLRRRGAGLTLPAVIDVLDAAARDPKIDALLVRIEKLECGLARAEEVRAALARQREAGKRVIVYAEELGLAGYWVALGASSIRLAPTGSLHVSGVAMEFTLLADVLSRAGVRAQLFARGKYKSMREMFTASRMSEPNREMLGSLVTDLSGQLHDLCASARGKSPEQVRGLLDEGPFRAEEAVRAGLIDSTQYWDELGEELGFEQGKVQGLRAYRRLLRRRHFIRRRPADIALLTITGTIRSGQDRPGPNGPRATGHRSFRQALRRVARTPKVRAIVLRVDSPGGSALASDLMWRELTLAAKKKPLFVSMVNMAASGGYYTSAVPGASIWASPTTLTGSIGVVGGKFEVSELLGKLGVGRETIASGPRANHYNPSTPWSADELEKVDRDIEAAYRDFVTKMAGARGLSYEALDRVAQGRVWTGRQALEAALVDRMGGLWDVARALREQLSLPSDTPLRWLAASAPRGLPQRRDEGAELEGRVLGWLEGHLPGAGAALALAADLSGERLLALAPVHPH